MSSSLHPDAQILYDAMRKRSKEWGEQVLKHHFITETLQELLETSLLGKLEIQLDGSCSFCIGDYEDPRAIWFTCSSRRMTELKMDWEHKNKQEHPTNLQLLEHAAAAGWQFIKHNGTIHFGPQG